MSSTPGRPGGPSTPGNPGFARQGTARTVFRVAGVVLLVGGVVAVGLGLAGILGSMAGDEFPEPGEVVRNFALFAGGAFAAVVGLALANAGFMGAAARYTSGEVAPVAKGTAAYLTDGEGLLGVGRTVDDAAPRAAGTAGGGAFCGSCGSARGAGDRFCTGCGAPTA